MAVYVDLLQSRRMRRRRDERGIHLVDGELLCHGYVRSAVDVGPGEFRMQRGPAIGNAPNVMTCGELHHSHVPCVLVTKVRPRSADLVGLEPAPPAPIAAATENQQYDENDQKGCRVHVALLRLANAREDHFTLSLGRTRWSG